MGETIVARRAEYFVGRQRKQCRKALSRLIYAASAWRSAPELGNADGHKAAHQCKRRYQQDSLKLFIKELGHVYVARNEGLRLACVACSNPYAISIRVGSQKALPQNEIPAGSSVMNPQGTVILG